MWVQFNCGVSNESNEIPMRFMGFRWGIMKFRGLLPDYWILRISIIPAGGGEGASEEYLQNDEEAP